MQFSDKKNVAYEVNPRMVVFSHESSIGDNQVKAVLETIKWSWYWEYKHTVMMTLFHRFQLNYFLLHIFSLKFLRLWL